MTTPTFEQAATALLEMTEAELQALAWLKALELLNAKTFAYVESILARNPMQDPTCKENLDVVRKAMAQKQAHFFGHEIDVRGENLATLIDYMADEFRKGRSSGDNYSEEFLLLEHKICVMCSAWLLPCIKMLAKTNRFATLADIAAMRHVMSSLEAEIMENFVSSIFDGDDSDIMIIRL